MPDIHSMYVFEVAQSIDLDQAEHSIGISTARQLFRYRGRATSYFQYRPAPLRVSQDGTSIAVGQWTTDPAIELVLYDFGAAAVTYRIPVPGDLTDLYHASSAFRRTELLRLDARARVAALLQSLGGAVTRPRVADFMEDYTIIGFREATDGLTAQAFCQTHRERIAQLLRPDSGSLSTEEVANAVDVRISFGPTDVTIVDWDAAFVLDPEPEDVRAVLEFANVQLLEMRWLDLQLDDAIERSYGLLARHHGWRALRPTALSADLNQVAELQLESAVMLERVSNALKVFGEEYLTRIYRLAAGRFQLSDLDGAITRKLTTIESIYQKLSDRATAIRMEVLEWVVIILIAAEIALGLAHR